MIREQGGENRKQERARRKGENREEEERRGASKSKQCVVVSVWTFCAARGQDARDEPSTAGAQALRLQTTTI